MLSLFYWEVHIQVRTGPPSLYVSGKKEKFQMLLKKLTINVGFGTEGVRELFGTERKRKRAQRGTTNKS